MPVLVVFAPTACGKTDLALKLFGKDSLSCFANRAEIISADSMQVYKGMDIGTAKPDADFIEKIPHHLIDICNPTDVFSAGDFVRCAEIACKEIIKKNKLPVILGGTGFYIRNFICGLPTTPEANADLREKLKKRMEQEGASVLYNELKEIDSISAKRIHINDKYRILRALEVFYASGKPLSNFDLSGETRHGFKFCTIILERDRQELYERINLRVKLMFEQGLVQEVENLIAQGHTKDEPGMQAIGYREFFSEEAANIDNIDERLEFIQNLISLDSRKYAKRQYTFFKGIPNANRFNASDIDLISSCVKSFYDSIEN